MNIFIMLILLTVSTNALALTTKEILDLQPVVHKQLVEISNKINEDLPRLVDSDTIMETTAVIKKSFTYRYTFVKYTSETLSGKVAYEYLSPKIINLYCYDPTMRIYKTFGYQMVHTYYGKDGKFITQIKVSKSNCK